MKINKVIGVVVVIIVVIIHFDLCFQGHKYDMEECTCLIVLFVSYYLAKLLMHKTIGNRIGTR